MNSITRPPGAASSLGAMLPPAAMRPDPPRPRPLRAGPFGVLDVGSTKVACLIGRADGDGTLKMVGFGLHESRGVRGGGVTDLEEAERSIRRAVADAEEMAGHRLRRVTVNLSCGYPESHLLHLQWPVGGKAVTEADIRRVVQEGRNRIELDGRETIHILPLDFAVDETTGVADPRGLHCEQLSARLHIVHAGATALRNLLTVLERCELELAELVSAPMAAGLATLVEDERMLGATVVDMGGGTTGVAVFSEGHLRHTAHLPVGGVHVTNDIARLLSTPVAHAERLKTLYGNAQGCPDDEREMLPVPLVGEAEHHIQKVPRSRVVEIIRPRLEETFELVRDRLASAGLSRESGNRVVLTGGASQLVGAREMASRILDRQVRPGRPLGVRGLPAMGSGPAFATVAGLLSWASGAGQTFADIDLTEEGPRGLFHRFVAFLRDRI